MKQGIMDSHFWKGHATSQKLINSALKPVTSAEVQFGDINGEMTVNHQEQPDSMGIVTHEDAVNSSLPASGANKSLTEFRRYSDAFRERQELSVLEISNRYDLLEGEIKKIKSLALKSFWLEHVKHVKIELMTSEQFSKALDNFIKPMVRAVNENYSNNDFPVNYSQFNRYLDQHKKDVIFVDGGILWSVDIADSFNKAMLHHANRNKLEKVKDKYEVDLLEIRIFSDKHVSHFGLSDGLCESKIKRLASMISDELGSMQRIQLQDEKPDSRALAQYAEKLRPIQDLLEEIKQELHHYELQLKIMLKDLHAAELTDEEKLAYKDLLDPKKGVEAQLKILKKHKEELNKIEIGQFVKLTNPLKDVEEKGPLKETLVKLKESLGSGRFTPGKKVGK